MYDLPITVTVGKKEFAIRNNADYRVILDVIAACQDLDLSKEEQAVTALIVFYECVGSREDIINTFDDIQEAIKVMQDFISLNNNEQIGYKTQHKLIDWIQDEKLIVSAVNNVARVEIRAIPYLHWWTFISYYMAIGECSLSAIVGMRDKIARGKKLEKHEQEFKSKNPEYFRWKNTQTQEEKELESYIDELWQES